MIVIASAFSFKKDQGEDHGEGLTEQEANFIKARMIDASKLTKDIESIGYILQPIVSAGLGNICIYLGIRIELRYGDQTWKNFWMTSGS